MNIKFFVLILNLNIVDLAMGMYGRSTAVLRSRTHPPHNNGTDVEFHSMPFQFRSYHDWNMFAARSKEDPSVVLQSIRGEMAMYTFWQRCYDAARGAGSRRPNYRLCPEGMSLTLDRQALTDPSHMTVYVEFCDVNTDDQRLIEAYVVERLRILSDPKSSAVTPWASEPYNQNQA